MATISHDQHQNDAETFDWSYSCILLQLQEFHCTHRDNMTAVVLLIVVVWMLLWIRAVNDPSRSPVGSSNVLGWWFLPCSPRSCARRSGSPRPCRRTPGTERGRCCRTLEINCFHQIGQTYLISKPCIILLGLWRVNTLWVIK